MVINTGNIKKDDVFVASYPRSGNTWLRYAITSLLYPDREISFELVNRTVVNIHKNPEYLLENKNKLRLIKTHDVFNPKIHKGIYIYRDIKNVAGSYYKFYKKHHGYKKDFEFFLYEMLDGKLAFGSWQEHIESWMINKHKKGTEILHLKYEDLLNDFTNNIKKIAEFINLDITNEDIALAYQNSSQLSQRQSYLPAGNQNFDIKKVKDKTYEKNKWKHMYTKEMNEHIISKVGYLLDILNFNRDY